MRLTQLSALRRRFPAGLILGFVVCAAATLALAQTADLTAPPLTATPAATMSATPIHGGSHLAAWLGVDIVKLVLAADVVGKASLIILGLLSIASWAVIVYKALHIRQAVNQTNEFVDICTQGNGDLEEAFRVSSNFPDSPLAQILREGYLELEVENWYREGYDLSDEGRMELAKVGIERIFERTITNEISHLESKLIFLATATNVAPFIGLFGTVWGVMGAFQALTTMTTAVNLTALAPGIATALLATVGGLAVAIPSSISYNYLTHRVRSLTSRMDAFALELSNVIQKQIIKQGAGMNSTGAMR